MAHVTCIEVHLSRGFTARVSAEHPERMDIYDADGDRMYEVLDGHYDYFVHYVCEGLKNQEAGRVPKSRAGSILDACRIYVAQGGR